MSERLNQFLATHLRQLRKAKFTDETGKQRPALGEAGLKVLVVLCNGADKDDEVWWGVTAITREAGLAPRTVKRVLAGFEQLGWLERVGEMPQEGRGGLPTVTYRVMLEHLGLDDNDDDDNAPKTTRKMRKSAPIVPSGAPIEPAKSKRGKGSKGNAKTETRNPKPETRNPQPSATDPGPGGGGLVVDRYEAAVDRAVAIEATRYLETHPGGDVPGTGLRNIWRVKLIREMERVLEAMDDPNCADADIETVARQAHGNYLAAKGYLHHPGRPGIDSPALRRPAMGSSASRGLPGCALCFGTGTIAGEPDSTGPGVPQRCPCRARVAG